MIFLRNVTACVAHRILHFWDCIGRARRHSSNFPVQHRDVVVVIACRENVFARDFQQTRQLSECRALVVISVTKPQPDRVALVIQLRMLASRLLDKFGYACHFFIILRDKAFKSFGIVNETCFGLSRYEIHDFGKNRVSRRKQLGVIAGTPLVPIAERLPFISILPGTENIALGRKNEIWADRELRNRRARIRADRLNDRC